MISKKLYLASGNINKYIFQTSLLSTFKLLSTIAFIWLFAFLLKGLILKDFDQYYFFILIFMLSIIFLRKLSTKIIALKLGDLVLEVKRNLRKAIFNKILNLGLNYSECFKIQEFIHLSVDNVEHLEVYFGGYLTQLYYCIASSIILFLSVAPFSLKIAFILLFFSLLIPLLLCSSLKKVKKIQKKYFAKYMNVGTLFLDSLQGITTLKLYGSDEMKEKEIAKMSEEFRIETMKVLKMQLLSIMVVNWIIYTGTILSIIFTISLFLNAKLNLFALFFIFMLTPEFFIPMRSLTSLFHVAMTGLAASDNIINFLEIEENKSYNNKKFPENFDITIRDLNFSYTDEKKALVNINMLFERNTLTAIVGHSGCGKSTLAAVISGELRTEEFSKINLTGLNLGDIKTEEISKNILKIGCDTHIFEGTVRDNLIIANPEASDEEMIEILKQLKLWDIFKFSNGLDYILKSQARNLSGGQAQRLSFARALLYKAKIYIFDEITSNIDIESEEIILNNIYELAKNKIVIFISHRLASIKNAHKIYVLERGKLIQSGKHNELYTQEGLYKNMYEHQEKLENYLKGSVINAN